MFNSCLFYLLLARPISFDLYFVWIFRPEFIGFAGGLLGVEYLRGTSMRDGQMVLHSRSIFAFIDCFALRARLL